MSSCAERSEGLKGNFRVDTPQHPITPTRGDVPCTFEHPRHASRPDWLTLTGHVGEQASASWTSNARCQLSTDKQRVRRSCTSQLSVSEAVDRPVDDATPPNSRDPRPFESKALPRTACIYGTARELQAKLTTYLSVGCASTSTVLPLWASNTLISLPLHTARTLAAHRPRLRGLCAKLLVQFQSRCSRGCHGAPGARSAGANLVGSLIECCPRRLPVTLADQSGCLAMKHTVRCAQVRHVTAAYGQGTQFACACPSASKRHEVEADQVL